MKEKDGSGDKIRQLAVDVLATHGKRRGIKTAVADLLNSRHDTLSDEEIIEELEAILSSGRQWAEIYARAK